ncbi:MAG: TIGR04255 family protein [Taibaiella sp.]|nr:TIGR04255 family protein [Taibaiella sp.]
MFGFPEVPKESIKRNFLKRVDIEFYYSDLKKLKESSENVWALFRNEFPRFTNGKNSGIKLLLEDGNPNVKTIPETDNLILKSKDGDLELIINQDHIKLSIDAENYDSFGKAIHPLKSKFADLISILKIENLSNPKLTKINLLDYEYGGVSNANGVLESLLNDNIILKADSFPQMEKLIQNFHHLEFKEADYILNLVYGMTANSNDMAKRGQLVIELAMQKKTKVENSQIYVELEKMNDEMFNIFHWLINSRAKSILND